MRCKKARECWLMNRDGLLGESGRVRLQQHLEDCPECASEVNEMEACLSMLESLPEPELSENFEWNIKRRIALEKAAVMRQRAGSAFSGGWGISFVSGAAAMLVIALAGAWFLLRDAGPSPSRSGDPASYRTGTVTAERPNCNINYTNTGYPTGIKMVSDDMFNAAPGDGGARQMPFSMESERRVEYLVKENALLREYLEYYKRENIYLKKLLLQNSSKR